MIYASNPSFNLAKQQIIYGLEKLTKVSNDMDIKYPAYGFKPLSKNLKIFKMSYEQHLAPAFLRIRSNMCWTKIPSSV